MFDKIPKKAHRWIRIIMDAMDAPGFHIMDPSTKCVRGARGCDDQKSREALLSYHVPHAAAVLYIQYSTYKQGMEIGESTFSIRIQ